MALETKTTQTAVIIGAGPAGLTAALELLRHTDIKPIILEKGDTVGGISRTVRFGENKMDIGGHRFFSKSDRVVKWWLDILPLEAGQEDLTIRYQHQSQKVPASEAMTGAETDDVMLVRKRKSRIFYEGKYYDYPIVLSYSTLKNLGVVKVLKILFTYVRSVLLPREEKTLEDFFINRFGTELYETFFKTYTQKVWGVPCTQIGPEWGRQRVKGLSVGKAVLSSITRPFKKDTYLGKGTETSLIEYFLYPKYGPGHLWERTAEEIIKRGGEIKYNAAVVGIEGNHEYVHAVVYEDTQTKEHTTLNTDYVFSTMPISELFKTFSMEVPQIVYDTATRLQFRDFISVGLLLRDAQVTHIKDNWLYIHDPQVHVGRIQFFHNWSPYLVATEHAHLLGFEYFCTQQDALWNLSEDQMKTLALEELAHIGIAYTEVLDIHIEKVPKAYPAYTGAYAQFDLVKAYLNNIANFYPIGRNGMHRYNNQDHSMLTAMASVESIWGAYRKEDVWSINAEEDYHEEK